MFERLKSEAKVLGKPSWRGMFQYAAELHERSTHPPREPFPYPWEEIGPGYHATPAFGHWDVVHEILDTMPAEPEHAANQVLNDLAGQQEDGLVPGTIYMSGEKPKWNPLVGHPPLWPVAAGEYFDLTGRRDLIESCYQPLLRQIGWFEKLRKVGDNGFYYSDMLRVTYESGIDQGVRFDEPSAVPFPCVDATSHVYQLYRHAADWSRLLGKDPTALGQKADAIGSFIREELFDGETGLFRDGRALKERRLAFEGMWPVVVGAAAPAQAARVIDRNLLDPRRFFTAHPISSVGAEDPKFELRMWRGPAWNSMTYWAARGCIRYDRPDAAARLLEKALDCSAMQFERTGTIWEFYHPHAGRPEDLRRKPETQQNTPCRDYLGHNPLLAMARMWEKTRE